MITARERRRRMEFYDRLYAPAEQAEAEGYRLFLDATGKPARTPLSTIQQRAALGLKLPMPEGCE